MSNLPLSDKILSLLGRDDLVNHQRLSSWRMLLKRGAGNGERKSGNELSAETSTKIQNGGPKNERAKEEDKERNSCLG